MIGFTLIGIWVAFLIAGFVITGLVGIACCDGEFEIGVALSYAIVTLFVSIYICLFIQSPEKFGYTKIETDTVQEVVIDD